MALERFFVYLNIIRHIKLEAKYDALDRFGTSLEQRFSKPEITEMSRAANFDLTTLKFSEIEQFWTFAVNKKK